MGMTEAEYLQQKSGLQSLATKFFFHLSLIAGGTFSLLVPYISSIYGSGTVDGLKRIIILKISLVFLVLTLLGSLTRNYANAHLEYIKFLNDHGSNIKDYLFFNGSLVFRLGIFTIFNYSISIVLVLIFILWH